MATHIHPSNNILKSKTITALPNGQFLIPFESHGSDDYCSVEYWSHYAGNKFQFSANIKIIAATYVFNGGAVLVEKIDPTIPEKIKISGPDMHPPLVITF